MEKNQDFEKEGRKCWICGAENTRLEAHEFWEYDDKNKLVAIHHLCSMCHKIKHIGFWCYTEDGRRQLKKAGLSREEFEKHEREAFKIWRETGFWRYDPNR